MRELTLAADMPGRFRHWLAAASRIVATGMLSCLSALVVGGTLYGMGWWSSGIPDPYGDPFAAGLASAAWQVVVWGPLIETLLLGLVYAASSTVFASRPSAAMAGLVLVGAHAVKGWPAMVCAVIPFVILSLPFASPRLSWGGAMLRSWSIHVVHNACVVAMVALALRFAGGEGPGQ